MTAINPVTNWFYKVGGQVRGPVSPIELRQKAATGWIAPDTLVRKGADGRWVRAEKVQGLFQVDVSLPTTAAQFVQEKPIIGAAAPYAEKEPRSFPRSPSPLPQSISQVASDNPRRMRGWLLAGVLAAGCILTVLITCLIWWPQASRPPDSRHPVTDGDLLTVTPVVPSTWLTISYADLLDRDAIVRTGQDLGSALRDSKLKYAVQPFVDGYSQLLPAAIEIANGPDQTPCHSVLDFFAPGERQPAWAAILRGGRIHIVTDDKNHAKVFLLGDDPTQAYSQNYSVVRHCLNMLRQMANGDINVDVFAYHNDYENSELRLDTTPYSFRANAFDPRKPVVNLDALTAFFAEGPEVQGAALNKEQGLILYGSDGPKQTLAGHPIELSDLAVAYRAVFHAGDNEAFISLDPNKDPTKATVNFGGFLENTRLGSVVLEADKRFKTITSGLDPNSFRDLRNYTRNLVPSFLSGSERDILSGELSGNGQWIGTRFWYYPDAIGVDSDLNWEYAVLTNPRFTADAERSREDFASREEFERKKRNMLSPSIRENIDDLNRNYVQYTQAFPEISELTTVARLMGLCSWLYKALPSSLDLDELLCVELPPCKTEVERTQLVAATFFSHSKAEIPDRDRIAAESKVVFLSPILEQTVKEVFQSPTNIVKYLSSGTDPSTTDRAKFDSEAARLFNQYQNCKVRDMLHTKRDVEMLATYAAHLVDVPPPSTENNLKTRITAAKTTLANLDSTIEQIKSRMNLETSAGAYNALVDRHNELVAEYEQVRSNLNMAVDQYNTLNVQNLIITEIGGGIDLEPSKFAIQQNPLSPSLIKFKNRTGKVGSRWTDTGESKKWIRSDSALKVGLPVRPRSALADQIADASQIKHWTRTDARDSSWKSAIRLDASRAQEKSYDSQQQTLQVAEFAAGQLQSLIIAQRDANGRIVFKRAERRNVLPPQDPPVWFSPIGGANETLPEQVSGHGNESRTPTITQPQSRAIVQGEVTKSAIHEAVRAKDKQAVWALVRKNPACLLEMEEGSFGYTPLHTAAEHGSQEMAELLLTLGADVNIRARNGETPLITAIGEHFHELALFFIAKGADVKVSSLDGETALHFAAIENMPDLAQSLIDKGAVVDARTNKGETPLHFAIEKGCKDVVHVLLKNGADWRADGKTPSQVPPHNDDSK